MKDIMGISLSDGTIYNIIKSMSTKAIPAYEAIKEKVVVEYKKQMTEDDYGGANSKVKEFENRLLELLEHVYSNEHRKLSAFIKRLIKKLRLPSDFPLPFGSAS